VAEVAPRAHDIRSLRRVECHEAAVDDRCQRAELELHLGDDAEVAAAALEAPEKLLVLVLGCGDELAVRGDDVGPDHVVGGEAVLALEPAAAGAGGEADDARRRHAAAGDGEAERLGLVVELAPVHAALGADGLALRVDPDSLHRPHVEDDAVVDRREARHRVAAVPDRERKPARPRKADCLNHACDSSRSQDDAGTSVEHAVEDAAELVVLRIRRLDDLAAELRPQLLQGIGFQGRCRHGAGHTPTSSLRLLRA
jgi:hypothetical protein